MSIEGLMLDVGMDVDMTKQEEMMYGMSVADIRAQYMNSATARLSGLEMVVMGIMSDCQEMLGLCSPNVPQPNTNEYLRKQMNIAKFILCEMMDQKETV